MTQTEILENFITELNNSYSAMLYYCEKITNKYGGEMYVMCILNKSAHYKLDWYIDEYGYNNYLYVMMPSMEKNDINKHDTWIASINGEWKERIRTMLEDKFGIMLI